MSQSVKTSSNSVISGGTGGILVNKFRPQYIITAGTTVTVVPLWTCPPDVTLCAVTNITFATGPVAPSSGTITVNVFKNGTTAVTTTSPAATTTVAINSSVSVGSAASTGYVIPVLVSPPITLVPGDSLYVTLAGSATATSHILGVEVTDMSGTP